MDSFLIMMNKILFHFHAGLIPVILISYWKILVVMMLGFSMVWFPESLKSRVKNSFLLLSDPVKAIMVFIIIIFVYQFKVSGIQPFIYFQF